MASVQKMVAAMTHFWAKTVALIVDAQISHKGAESLALIVDASMTRAFMAWVVDFLIPAGVS
jgi:hypothetical protein